MTQQNQTTALTLSQKASEIDRIATQAMSLFDGASSFQTELEVAKSIQDLRAALTPDIMAPVMALMNTDLGFLTDRDPRKSNKPVTPYSADAVRDVLIESFLRGFHTIGNEFNIIAGRFYAARNGLKRRCETYPGVTEPKILIGVPKNRDGGAIVSVKGTWKKDGVPDSIETEIAVRVNEFMGVDAIVGKAERKLYKRILDRLSGKVTPDGDIGDAEMEQAKPANATVVPPKTEAATQPAATTTTTQAPTQTATTTPPAQKPPPPPAPSGSSPQDELAEIVIGAGYNFDQFKSWAKDEFRDGDSHTGILSWDTMDGFEQVPLKLAALCKRAKTGMINGLMGLNRGDQP